MDTQRKLLLTVQESAAELSVSRSYMYELISACKVESVRIGSARRIPYDSLVAYVEQLRALAHEEGVDA